MFENLINFLKKLSKNENNNNKEGKSKDRAKERLQLVLTQDRANVSADFLELMKQEIIDVIKKYIEVEENAIDVRITNKLEDDGTTGSPSLYANIPIINIKKEAAKEMQSKEENEQKTEENKQENNTNEEQKEEVKKDKEKNKSNSQEKPSKENKKLKEDKEKEISVEKKDETDS